jgi:GT2 family glycosyltransferase
MARVAIVIITRDRAPELLRSLGRLHALAERPEIVVVDNGSRDGTAEQVHARFPRTRVLRLEEDRGAAGRTAGVRAVAAPYVAFCDDDAWFAPGALARGVAVLDAHPRVGLLAARVLLGEEERLEPACAAMAASPLASPPDVPGLRVLGFVACAAIVRRDAFLDVGGFDARFGIGGEEGLLAADLAARGWSLVYCPDVLAHHHPSHVRDRSQRRAAQVRNDLWFSWLRRAPRAALAATLATASAALRDPVARAGLRLAIGGGLGVLASRRPLPAGVEADFRLLDAQRSGASNVSTTPAPCGTASERRSSTAETVRSGERSLMDDKQVQNHIEQLVAEEHRLLGHSSEQGLTPTDHERLAKVRVELDRYWDLLRQRRAREEFGEDPDSASLRDEGTVEGYEG